MNLNGRPAKFEKSKILDAALMLARNDNYLNLSRTCVAEAANCAPATISRLFGTMVNFRRAVMSAAVARNDLVVIAQGLIAKDTKAGGVADHIKTQALELYK
jgi:hypothetical protein